MTDIVIGTYNRVDTLRRTVAHIVARTRTPYRLTVIDDASPDGTAAALRELLKSGAVASARRRHEHCGISANLRALLLCTTSDPLVVTDDDVLCPEGTPDWLALLLSAMASRPQLGILALNNPQCRARGTDRRAPYGGTGAVTLCRNVGATFALVRRAVLEAVSVPDHEISPFKYLCLGAAAAGFTVGYLTATYCQHIGAFSRRVDMSYGQELAMVMPLDERTLEPPHAYQG